MRPAVQRLSSSSYSRVPSFSRPLLALRASSSLSLSSFPSSCCGLTHAHNHSYSHRNPHSVSSLQRLARRSLCSDKTPPTPTPAGPSAGVSGSFSDVPGVRSEGDKYAMMYTCGVCDTRAAKMVSKQAYHHGTVLIRCPQCQNLHLIADHLGQFEEKGWTVEQFLEAQGEKVRHVASDNVLELTMADIAGSGAEDPK